jgi:hypothetical protein
MENQIRGDERMTYIGVNQSPDIDKTMQVAQKYILEGKDVRIHVQHFTGALTREHPYPIEYEVYVDMGDE